MRKRRVIKTKREDGCAHCGSNIVSARSGEDYCQACADLGAQSLNPRSLRLTPIAGSVFAVLYENRFAGVAVQTLPERREERTKQGHGYGFIYSFSSRIITHGLRRRQGRVVELEAS